jgi:DNA-binding IclR family transcriptional regulator
LAHGARAVALELTGDTGYATSVTELVGDAVAITALNATPDVPTALLGDRFPYAPPFGIAFAAWQSDAERAQWVRRATVGNGKLEQRLLALLEATHDRGYHVDHATPAMLQMTQIGGTLHGADPTPAMRRILEELLIEMMDSSPEGSAPADPGALVTTIAAPVLDHRNRVTLNVSIHPIRPLSARQIERLGRRLRNATAALSAAETRG